MVKYICDRCGAIPSEDYKNPGKLTHNTIFGFFKNGHTFVSRSFDLCDKCVNDSVDLTDAFGKVFGRLMAVFLKKETTL